MQIRDVSDEATHWESVGRILLQGGLHSDKKATSERERRRVDIPPAGGRDGGSGTAGDGYLRPPPLQNGCTDHCGQANYGPMFGSIAETGDKDIQAVVVTQRSGCGRDAGGTLGGKTYRGGGGDGQDRDGDGDGDGDGDRDRDGDGDGD